MTPSTRSTVRVVGSVLALLLVLGAALSGVAQAARTSTTSTHALPADLTSVELSNAVGRVLVTAVDAGEEPRVVVTATGGFTDPTFEVEESGGAVSLAGRCPKGLLFGPCDVDWRVFVPADVDVSVETSVGDVVVTGAGRTVRAASDVGSVTVAGVRARTVDVQGSVGDVVVDVDVAPELLTARTSTGDVEVTVPEGSTAYQVRSSTSVGSVRTQVPVDDGSPHRLELLTSVGDVSVRTG